MSLDQYLEAIADSENRSTPLGERPQWLHDRCKAGDRATPQVVAVAEPAGHDDRVETGQIGRPVVHQIRRHPDPVPKGVQRIMVAVAARKSHDSDSAAHRTTSSDRISVAVPTSNCSITGFERSCSAILVTACLAASTVGASTSTTICRPTRTRTTPA